MPHMRWDDILFPTDSESAMNKYVPLDLFWDEAESLMKEKTLLPNQEKDQQLHCHRIEGAQNRGPYYLENFLRGNMQKVDKNEL